MQVFGQIKTDKLAWSPMKAMMRCGEMLKVLKWHAEGRNALLSGKKQEKRVLFIRKDFWICTNTDDFFWRTDLF